MTKAELKTIKKSSKEIRELQIALAETNENSKYSADIEMFAKKLKNKISELETAKDRLFDVIMDLSDSHTTEMLLLLDYYIYNQRAEDIAEKRCEDISGVYRKLRKAEKLIIS